MQRKHSSKGRLDILKNFGNTCFIDSVLQALFHVNSFVESVHGQYKGSSTMTALKNLFDIIYIDRTDKKEVDEKMKLFLNECGNMSFIQCLMRTENKIGFMQQQDSCEFLEHLLKQINFELFEKLDENGNIISTAYEISGERVNLNKTNFHKSYNLNMLQITKC